VKPYYFSISALMLFISIHSLEYIRPFAPYYSQCGQDKYLNENVFFNKKNGVFIEIGAHDGVSFSNTYYFERMLGWTGICIEPNPDRFEQLKVNRKAICLNACVSDFNGSADFIKITGAPEMLSGLKNAYDPRHLDRIDLELSMNGGSKEIIQVDVLTLQSIVNKYQIKKIDFLSVDTEGSELFILKSIDLSAVDIEVIIVENNYDDPKIHLYLLENGYILLTRLDGDSMYQKRRK
jgi:FkbM family methyltransferase